MTTIPQAASREAFEKDLAHLYKGFYNRDPNNAEAYKNERVHSAWVGWQAATSQQQGKLVALREQLRILRDGLEHIRDTDFCNYPSEAIYDGEHTSGYRKGITDGHRLASSWGRDALQLADAVKGGA